MEDNLHIGDAPDTLVDLYEANKDVLRPPGTYREIAKRLADLLLIDPRLSDPVIYIRFLSGEFSPDNDDDLRTLASIARAPRWFTDSEKLTDAAFQIEQYFRATGKRAAGRDLEASLVRIGVKL